MTISVRVESCNPEHTTLRIFVNGASAGLLTVRTEGEAEPLIRRLLGDDDQGAIATAVTLEALRKSRA